MKKGIDLPADLGNPEVGRQTSIEWGILCIRSKNDWRENTVLSVSLNILQTAVMIENPKEETARFVQKSARNTSILRESANIRSGIGASSAACVLPPVLPDALCLPQTGSIPFYWRWPNGDGLPLDASGRNTHCDSTLCVLLRYLGSSWPMRHSIRGLWSLYGAVKAA